MGFCLKIGFALDVGGFTKQEYLGFAFFWLSVIITEKMIGCILNSCLFVCMGSLLEELLETSRSAVEGT